MQERLSSLITLLFSLTTVFSSIPHPDFESGWLPIINGLEHVARLNVDHGLGEIPILVDVSVKVNDNIFPASGFRPDHSIDRSGPVIYIYDAMFVNVSTTPNGDRLFRIGPSVISRFYRGTYSVFMGTFYIRVRAWKRSSLPVADFHLSGITLKANTSKAEDSFAEISHSLGETPCLVVVRMQLLRDGDVIIADGVGSSMQVFADVPDRTNAYLVYGYSNTTFRLWVDSSRYGAIFDGRKHTWFDFVISEGDADIFAWTCSTVKPFYNKRVVTKHTLDRVPEWWNVNIGYDMEYSFVRVSIKAEQPGGANEGFRFPGTMHIGYPAPSEEGNSVKPVSVGGLSYSYETRYTFTFWQPSFRNRSSIFISESFGAGVNAETSHSESIYIQSWIFEENTTCVEPVIYQGFANTSLNGTSTGAEAVVFCNDGYLLKPRLKYSSNTIKCHRFGYWENMPSCIPQEKEVGTTCNPAEDKCHDHHATCSLAPSRTVYRCLCGDGFKQLRSRCVAEGKYLPTPDYDSDWKAVFKSTTWNLFYEHGLGTVPLLVDVQLEVSNWVFQAIGFGPDQDEYSDQSNAVVYVYDNKFINISLYLAGSISDNLLSVSSYRWYGYQISFGQYGRVRARAWKAESLSSPDVKDTTHVMRANTSKTSDSFYELKHDLNEYPGLVVVRGKMVYNNKTVFANGVGSALNVFHNDPDMTNAFLVYGYSNSSFRVWTDSSQNGAIFDGRRHAMFDFLVSQAIVEIYAWKISTITPYFTYKFSLEDHRFSYSVKFPVNFRLSDGLNMAFAEISDPSAKNKGFRFPSSAYMADRYMRHDNGEGDDCIFGGFTYGFQYRWMTWKFIKDIDMEMIFYKPVNLNHTYSYTGSLLCIPDTFGNGEYTEAAFNGVGTLYSWLQADCGEPPRIDHGYINTTKNGTDIGAVASVQCDDGYRLSAYEMPRCSVAYPVGIEWDIYVSCRPVECGTLESPQNGTMNVTGEVFGSTIIFGCDDGYELDGNKTVECLSNGNWSASTPDCKSKVSEDETSSSYSDNSSKMVVGLMLAFVIMTAVI